jgi:stearoyl-CoA desaturase (delta-9 desaturase)
MDQLLTPELSQPGVAPQSGAPVDESLPPRVRDPMRLSRPSGTRPLRLQWPYLVGVVGIHALALFALLPYCFSWTGVVLAFAGLYVYGTLGINLGYHRLLTHQGFKTSKWLERLFSTLGMCCLQGPPARWVAVHRMHHQHSDQETDPHSPWVDVLWGHVGWLLVNNRDLSNLDFYERYARDILRDRYYRNCERGTLWVWIYVVHALAYAAAGLVLGGILSGTVSGALQWGVSLLVWGVAVRTVLVWHITWSVNSITHLWGYRSYETGESSRNNWFVALISNGEGWHNNHHADQRAAAHGHRWWEFDVTWLTIRALAATGLATEVIAPRSWSKSQVES